MSGLEKALGLVKSLPRVQLSNLKPLPWFNRKKRRHNRRGQHGGKTCGRGTSGQGSRGKLPRLGFEGGNTPFYLQIPKEPYYHGFHVRRQYPPLTLKQLQHLIDLGWIDPSQPIDLTTLCNCPIKPIDPHQRQYGFNLTDEGADIFDAKVNIEVQWSSELTIAAIEKNGGTIVNKFYDLDCVKAMANSLAFFKRGEPIPKNRTPPQDALEFYTATKSRGYLSDPALLGPARYVLAQKYGYSLPDLTLDPLYGMLTRRKDPAQIWFGLEPGWVVNLRDKTVIKAKDENMIEFYNT